MSVAARFVVRGVVQGVHFRAFTQREAQRLGLCGHAINLRDGSVEVLARGELQALAALERWLHEGSPEARVDSVRREPVEGARIPDGFTTG